MQIMRRQPGEKAPNSESNSKTTSEIGSDDGSNNNDNDTASSTRDTPARGRPPISREEKWEMYEQARLRIFGDFDANVKSANGNTTTGSRSPSTSHTSNSNSNSTRRKPNKQRTPIDDSFEGRSRFVPFTSVNYPGGQPYTAMIPDASYAAPPQYGIPGYPPVTNAPVSYAQSVNAGQFNSMYQSQPNSGMAAMPQPGPNYATQFGQTPWAADPGLVPGTVPSQAPMTYSPYSIPPHMPNSTAQQSVPRMSPQMGGYVIPSPNFNAAYSQPAPSWNPLQFQYPPYAPQQGLSQTSPPQPAPPTPVRNSFSYWPGFPPNYGASQMPGAYPPPERKKK